MAGTAGVTMVMSREDRRTDRQRGVMVSAITVPEGRLDVWSRDSGRSGSTEGDDNGSLIVAETSTWSAIVGPSLVGKGPSLLTAVVGLCLSRPSDTFAHATGEVGVD